MNINKLKNNATLQNVKSILGILDKSQRAELLAVFFVCVIASIFDALGVASVLPFVALVTSQDTIDSVRNYIIVYSNLTLSDTEIILISGLISVVLLLLSLFARAFTFHRQYKFALAVEKHLGVKLLEGYLFNNYLWHASNNSSTLIKNILSECGVFVHAGLLSLLTIVAQTITVLLIFFLLLFVSPTATISSCVFIVFFYGLCLWAFRGKLYKLGEDQALFNSLRFLSLTETFGALKEILFKSRQLFFVEKFQLYSEKFMSTKVTTNLVSVMPRYVLEAAVFAGLIFFVIVFVANGGDVVAVMPLVAAFTMAGYRLMPAMQQIYGAFAMLANATVSIEIVKSGSVFDGLTPMLVERDTNFGHAPEIVVENLSFVYPGSDLPAVSNLSFKICAGEFVAIVGRSGSGKSTLVDLLLGLYKPTSGAISFFSNGIQKDINKCRDAAYVPQNVFLSDSSIRDNIAFGLDPLAVRKNSIESVVEIAQIKPFSDELPDGLDTLVGESACRLSGGQKQRIGIARALFENPRLLIIDEGTSAIDVTTEKLIVDRLLDKKGIVTTLFVTHRPETAARADWVLEL